MNDIGIKMISESYDIFKRFAHVIEMPTTQCQTFITGGNNLQMNYIYDLDINDEQLFIDELAMLRDTKIPMMLLCDEASAQKHDALFKNQHLMQIGSAQSKYIMLAGEGYAPSNYISMQEVTTPAMMKIWREIAATGFEYPDGCDNALFDEYLTRCPHNTVKLYLAYIDGQAAGQCMLVLGDESSSNMWSSTLPQFRKRGILSEMIKHRNHMAYQQGYTHNIVQCMPSSAPMYDCLNYKNAEKINLYTV